VPKSQSKSQPKSTLVLLVRHGKTPTTGDKLPGRAPGLHLSDQGREQAERAAARIGALHRGNNGDKGDKGSVTAVYASPMERTKETAGPIAKAVGKRVRTDAGLLECEFGAWTGQKLSTLRKKPEWRAVQRYPSSFRFPRGESFAEMQARMTDALHRLVAAHPGDTIVAVSHADPIKAAVADAMGTHLDLFQRIVISPCSISAIWYGSDGPAVLTVNSTGDDLRGLALS